VPLIAQVPGTIVDSHIPTRSSHASLVHESPSVHVVSVTQTAAPLQRPHPDVVPSLHRVPVRGVQLVGLPTGSHQRQGLPLLTVIAE
jgi:hypothetical protein